MVVEIDSTSSSSTISFTAARSAKDFVVSGFVLNDRDGAIFNAPDAETLLDDDFRDGYCFEIRRADRARANQVGLRFIAAHTQRGRIDVDGTLWVDTVARRLRDIEFTYQNLPAAIARLHPGGQVRFLQLDNGIVIVDRWSLRTPARTVTTRVAGRTVTAPTGTQQTGGAIASARWPGGLQWDAPLAVLQVDMVDSLEAPESGRTLLLANTNYQAVSDSDGVATIGRLLPGPYTGAVRDPRLDSISIALTTSFAVTVADGEKIERRLRVPTAADYIAGRCRASSSEPDSTGKFLIIGRVFDRENKPIGQALWSIAIQTPGGPEMVQAGIASSDGIFEYCAGPFHLNDQIVIDTRRSAEDPHVLLPLTVKDRIIVVPVTLPPEGG